jgi:pSer/pThr/pTyr-binding forkhead associated (FHA) protein
MPTRFHILPANEGAATGASAGRAGPLCARDVEIADGYAEIRMGRRPDLELSLPFPALSALHARVSLRDSAWWLEDLGSTNGTWLDGARLGPRQPRPLARGASLMLGNVRLRFDGTGPAQGVAEGTGTIARRLVNDLLGASSDGAPSIRVISGGAVGQRLSLTELERAYTVGRAESCDLPLPVEEVSREHAVFLRSTGGVLVRDPGSKNGVVVGGARIDSERRLADGDVVRIGPVTLGLDDPVDRYLRELEALAAAPPEPSPPSPAASVVEAASEQAVVAEPAARPVRSIGAAQLTVFVAGAVLVVLAAAAIALLSS